MGDLTWKPWTTFYKDVPIADRGEVLSKLLVDTVLLPTAVAGGMNDRDSKLFSICEALVKALDSSQESEVKDLVSLCKGLGAILSPYVGILGSTNDDVERIFAPAGDMDLDHDDEDRRSSEDPQGGQLNFLLSALCSPPSASAICISAFALFFSLLSSLAPLTLGLWQLSTLHPPPSPVFLKRTRNGLAPSAATPSHPLLSSAPPLHFSPVLHPSSFLLLVHAFSRSALCIVPRN